MSFLLAPQIAPFAALGGAYVYGNHKIDQWEAADTAARRKAATWYHSPAEMYQSNPSYQRQVDRLIRGARKPDLVLDNSGPVPSPAAAATSGVPLTKVPDPARYFTDKLLREPVTSGWWAHLKETALHNPVDLVRVALDNALGGLKWIGWNYVDLIDQWKSWDGTVTGFLGNSQLMWRTLMAVGITTGLVLAAPLMEALYVWARLVWQLLEGMGSIAAELMSAVWYVVEDVIQYLSTLLPSRW